MLSMLKKSILITLLGAFLVGCVNYKVESPPLTLEQRVYAAVLEFDYLTIAAQHHCLRPTSSEDLCRDLYRISAVGASIADQVVILLKAKPQPTDDIESMILDLAAIVLELEAYLEGDSI